MLRKAIEITLTLDQKKQLEGIVRSHSAERRLVERVEIILSCASGKRNQEIAQEYETLEVRVGKWRKRFAQYGIAELEDEQRSGKLKRYDVHFRDKLLATLKLKPPGGFSRWDCPLCGSVLITMAAYQDQLLNLNGRLAKMHV